MVSQMWAVGAEGHVSLTLHRVRARCDLARLGDSEVKQKLERRVAPELRSALQSTPPPKATGVPVI